MDPAKQLFKWARTRARRSGLAFEITLSDVKVPYVCPVLGLELHPHKAHVGPNSPTIDRKDNTRGYTPDNVWVISSLANAMKNRATVGQLRLFARWVQGEYGGVSNDTHTLIDVDHLLGLQYPSVQPMLKDYPIVLPLVLKENHKLVIVSDDIFQDLRSGYINPDDFLIPSCAKAVTAALNTIETFTDLLETAGIWEYR